MRLQFVLSSGIADVRPLLRGSGKLKVAGLPDEYFVRWREPGLVRWRLNRCLRMRRTARIPQAEIARLKVGFRPIPLERIGLPAGRE